MKEFFDSLDEKAAAFFKSKFGSKKVLNVPEVELDPNDIGAPIFLMMGSLSGCTMKDAVAYAKGMAESYVTAPELCRWRVFEDADNGRFVYEIHEGGPGFSIVEKVLEQLAQGFKVRVRLVNGAYAVIEDPNSELFSLIYPAEDEVSGQSQLQGFEAIEPELETPIVPIDTLCGPVALKELFPVNKKLTNIGGVILGVGISVFILTGAAYTVLRSGVLDGDALLRQTKAGVLADAADNPVWQMEKARMASDKDGKSVRALKKDKGGWSWELEK